MATDTGGTLDDCGLVRLMAWLSPAFPVGAYTYSHGIEYAVERGLVRDRDGLTRWVTAILRHGAGAIDAVLFRHAHQAATGGDGAALAAAVERAEALRSTAETATESAAQGSAFLDTVCRVWPDPRLETWAAQLAADCRAPAYAVAIGAAAGWLGLPLRPAMLAFLQATAANLVSAGVRLIPLGQTDGQRAVAALEEMVTAAAAAALARSDGDFGTATPVVDWTSMRHETQYTRLFRS
jgi:urease accessory protein